MERTYSVIVSNKEQSWSTFVAWCEAHKLCPAPAHPWTVAAYLRSLEGTMRLDAIRRHLAQVGRMHFEKVRKRPDRHPLVERTLASMRQRGEAAKRPPPPPLFRAEDFLERTPAPPPKRRDKSDKTAAAPHRTLRVTPKLVRRKRV